MGIAERKNKEKEELKALILKAAHELFIEKGIDETSIRNIAERIEYSPATIYLYFKDKDEIFYELHSQGFELLRSRMMVLQSVSDPLERLKALGRVYLDFAFENSEVYYLMFIARAPMQYIDKVNELHWTEGVSAFDFLVQTVAGCIEAGRFKGQDPESLSFVIWSTVHGMVSLDNSGRCKGVSPDCLDTKVLIQKAYDEFVKILDKM